MRQSGQPHGRLSGPILCSADVEQCAFGRLEGGLQFSQVRKS